MGLGCLIDRLALPQKRLDFVDSPTDAGQDWADYRRKSRGPIGFCEAVRGTFAAEIN